MARKCVRKTDERATWSPDNIQKAVNTVKKGYMSINIHASTYNMRGSTLTKRLKVEPSDVKVTKLERRSALGSDREAELEQIIMDIQAHGLSLTRLDIERLANEFMEASGLNHNFNKDSELARTAWVTSFLERHPNVVPRKVEGLMSNATAMAVNWKVCKQHFNFHQGWLVCFFVMFEVVFQCRNATGPSRGYSHVRVYRDVVH